MEITVWIPSQFPLLAIRKSVQVSVNFKAIRNSVQVGVNFKKAKSRKYQGVLKIRFPLRYKREDNTQSKNSRKDHCEAKSRKYQGVFKEKVE